MNEGNEPKRSSFRDMYSAIGTSSPEQFYRLAAQCKTECLIGVIRDLQTPEDTWRNGFFDLGGTLTGERWGWGTHAPIITAGGKFANLSGFDLGTTGYKDRKSGLVYESMWGASLATAERAALADKSQTRIVYVGPWGRPVAWDEELRVARRDFPGPNPASVQGSTADTVSSAIERIANGQHQELPQPIQVPLTAGQTPGWLIENATAYQLHLYLSGPVQHSYVIQTGGAMTIDLPPGSYRIAADVPDKSVLPFYAVRQLNADTRWKSHFYIARQ